MGFTFLAFAERERLQARRRKETTPERDARLDDLRERAQARRRRLETTSERQMRQEQDCVRYHASRQIDHSAPLFGQPAVCQKMRSFHSALVAAQFHIIILYISRTSCRKFRLLFCEFLCHSLIQKLFDTNCRTPLMGRRPLVDLPIQ